MRIVLAVVTIFVFVEFAQAQLLQSARDDVRSSSRSSRSERDDDDCDDDDDESILGMVVGGFFEALFTRKERETPLRPIDWQYHDPILPLHEGPEVGYRENEIEEKFGESAKDLIESPGYARFDVTYGSKDGELEWVGGHLLFGRGLGIDTRSAYSKFDHCWLIARFDTSVWRSRKIICR